MDRVNQRTNHLLGENIRKLRLKKNIRNKDMVTQLQLHGIEISTGTYSKVELGLNNPSVDLLIALTDILDCDFNAFFKIEKKQLLRLSQEFQIGNKPGVGYHCPTLFFY